MKTFLYSILCLTVVILSGCSKDEKVTEFLKVTSGFTYTVDAVGGTVNVNVETNTDYFVSIPDDAKNWISVVGSQATMQDVFSLSVTANNAASRTAKISLKNKSGEVLANIQISQEVQSIKITDGATYEVDPAGEIINVNLETNTDYTVSIPDNAKDWISIVESRAIRQETVTLSISENNSDDRSAFIYLIDKKGEQLAKIQISQKCEEPCFNVKNGSIVEVESKGGSVDLNFETNIEYSVSIPEESKNWISVVESRAIRQETVTLSISENDIEARSAFIYLIDKKGEQLAKVQISQKGEDPCFNVKNGSIVEVESKGGTVDLNLETNIEYSVLIPEEAKNWISMVESRAIRQETITLSINENDGDERSATIRFVDNNKNNLASIEINQEKGEIDVDPTDPSTIPSDMTKAFPDEIFRSYVLNNFDTNRNGIISEEEALNVKKIVVEWSRISSLEGIQYFPNLEYLLCRSNPLTSLDVSKNIALTYLDCSENRLTSLDVSGCNALTRLRCGIFFYDYFHDSYGLTSLDVSSCTALTELACYGNRLTSLDVSKNTALTYLHCRDNRLTSLDVSKNTELTELYCDVNELRTLDVSKNTALTLLSCNSTWLTKLDVSKNIALTELNCYGNVSLRTLDVSGCIALTSLKCYKNKLTSLDVSKNIDLTYLDCSDNQLTSLDVSRCIALTYLDCRFNQLTTLDVSKNTKLTSLDCRGNQLTSLDVSKNTKLTDLNCNISSLQTLYIKYGYVISNLEIDSKTIIRPKY